MDGENKFEADLVRATGGQLNSSDKTNYETEAGTFVVKLLKDLIEPIGQLALDLDGVKLEKENWPNILILLKKARRVCYHAASITHALEDGSSIDGIALLTLDLENVSAPDNIDLYGDLSIDNIKMGLYELYSKDLPKLENAKKLPLIRSIFTNLTFEIDAEINKFK